MRKTFQVLSSYVLHLASLKQVSEVLVFSTLGKYGLGMHTWHVPSVEGSHPPSSSSINHRQDARRDERQANFEYQIRVLMPKRNLDYGSFISAWVGRASIRGRGGNMQVQTA